MIIRRLVWMLLLFSTPVFALTQSPSLFSQPQTLPLAIRLDYLAINMPNNQPQLGIAGLHLLHPIRKNFYAGFGIYSAMTGGYNGFFSLGLDAGLMHRFAQYVGVDAGVYTGASGGHGLGGTQIGDGPLVIAHAGLIFYIKRAELSVSDSYTQFFEGEKIGSQQLLAALSIPFNLASFTVFSDIPAHFKATAAASYIGIPVSLYIPDKAYFASGAPITQTMTVMGVEFGQMIVAPVYYYLGVENAVSGTTIGFSIVKGGLELIRFIHASLFADMRLGLLSAGGNAVNSGGGLSGEAQAGMGVYVTKALSLRWLTGYLSAFTGQYHDITTSLVLDYHFSILSLPGENAFDGAAVVARHFRIRLGNQLYFAYGNFAGAASTINSFNVKIDDVLTTHWFVTGQGSFSYSGVPGCYATGLLGLGYQIPVTKKGLLYVSAMGGGGSGALTSLGQGTLLQGSVGALYQLTQSVAAAAAISKASVINTAFSPWVFDAGLAFDLRFLTA